jgi:hypothetical protein
MYFSGFQTHRNDRIVDLPRFSRHLRESVYLIINTQYHSGSFKTILIIATLVFTFLINILNFKKKNHHFNKIYLLINVLALIITIYFLFPYLQVYLGNNNIKILNSFDFSRFYMLLPLVWLLILALCSNILLKKNQHIFVIMISCLQIFSTLYYNQELRYNYKKVVNTVNHKSLNFNNYFDINLFSQIDKFIGEKKDTYRVVSVGLSPSISQYNGFYTLDSYQNSYPLYYKREFRKIISLELEKNNELKKYYDNWGSRVYVFSNELWFNNNTNNQPINLNINTVKLKEMKCKYIFSTNIIRNANTLNIKMLKMFENPNTYWRIYLYKLI